MENRRLSRSSKLSSISVSSHKLLEKLSEINSNKSLESIISKDSFFRRNGGILSQKKDIITNDNLMLVLRSDILEVESLIKNYSDVYYKINTTK